MKWGIKDLKRKLFLIVLIVSIQICEKMYKFADSIKHYTLKIEYEQVNIVNAVFNGSYHATSVFV